MSTEETWSTKENDEKLIGTLVGPRKDIRILGIAYRDTTTYSYMDFTVFNAKCEKCGREYQISRNNLSKAVCRVCGNSTKYNYDKPGYLDDIINKKVGKLTVLSFDHFEEGPIKKGRTNPSRKAMYKCQCECGNITYVDRHNLVKGDIKSCGCANKRPGNTHTGTTKGLFEDPEYLNEIVGKKFNMLTVLKFDHIKEGKIPKGRTKPRRHAMYLCRCDCGNTKIVDRANLIRGDVKSCGCINYLAQPKHGNAKDRIYHEWQGMKNRCLNPNIARWKDYGGRGITICPEWIGNTPAEGFVAFRDWAYANGYRDDLTIDRIDNDGPYAPWNCRWVTNDEQAWNKSTTVHIEVSGNNNGTIRDLYNSVNTSVPLDNVQRRFANNTYDNFANWSDNDKLFIPPNCGRDNYRTERNIKDVFTFDEDSPYKK